MLLRTVLRVSAGTRVLPFLLGFVLVALGDDLTAWITPAYGLAAAGHASLALPFAGAACAAAGAWEGGRLHRGRVFDRSPVRSPLTITAPLLLPVAVMGGLGMVTALGTTAAAGGTVTGVPQPGVLAVWAGLLLADTLIGSVVGRVLAPVVAVPLALVSSFVLNAYPASFDTYWLRHLVGGGLADCCAVDQVLDGRAVASSLVFSAAVCSAAVLLIRQRGAPIALAAALAVTAAGIGLAAHLARDLGPEPVRTRSAAALVCDHGRPRVCLWPELGAARSTMVRAETRRLAGTLAGHGVPVPEAFTMAGRPGPGEAKLGVPTDARVQDVAPAVVGGLLPRVPDCALHGGPYPAGAAAGTAAAWLAARAGPDGSTVPPSSGGRFDDADTARAAQLLRLPREAQLDWYRRAVEALGRCGAPPPAVGPGTTTAGPGSAGAGGAP
ncbi:DUF7224 domain-containing protein [Streptomyces sp. BE303]|uniref:DUF7224 domain-containing protein n=1 Tax=Streptomyces sp. BE303 TaxID=3002528 RepID=UPI002E790D17|nr:hypothetical protein [Streptomyces sp. BE303]MED7948329.1 hypothetical protein [Streptomyces sp. BE303]